MAVFVRDNKWLVLVVGWGISNGVWGRIVTVRWVWAVRLGTVLYISVFCVKI